METEFANGGIMNTVFDMGGGTMDESITPLIKLKNIFADTARVYHVQILEDSVEVYWRQSNPYTLTSNPPGPTPDSIWKNIIKFVGGKMQIVETVRGRHVPASTIPEQITFE